MVKKLVSLTGYELQVYFRGSRFVMPFVAALVFLYSIYSVKPVGILDSTQVSGNFIFILLVWMGLSAAGMENRVEEQILLLRVQNQGIYYFSKLLFLTILGIGVSCLCILIPAGQNLFSHGTLFTRTPALFDVSNAFLLLVGCSFAGGAVGSFLHPRAMRDRKTATVLTVLLALLVISRTVLEEAVPFCRAVTWLLPPVAKLGQVLGNGERFVWSQTLCLTAGMLLAGGVLWGIKTIILNIKKF